MATLEPRVIGDAPPNTDHPTTTMLNADIQYFTTSKDITKDPTLKLVFGSVVAILTLVRDQGELIEEAPLVELAKLCSRACHVLKTIDHLGCLGRTIEDSRRTIRAIESTIRVRQRVNQAHGLKEPGPSSSEEFIIAFREKLCEILRVFDEHHCKLAVVQLPQEAPEWSDILEDNLHLTSPAPVPVPTVQSEDPNSLSSFPDETLNLVAQVSPPPPIHSTVPFLPHSKDIDRVSGVPLILDSDRQDMQRLVSGTVPRSELASLIERVVSNVKANDIVESIRESDAQVFIDVMDEALGNLDFPPQIRSKCVRSLYKMCAGHAMFPRTLRFELPGDAMDDVRYRGGFADVLRCECGGREVAAKALRPQGISLQGMRKRFYREVITWKSLRHPNVLELIGVVMTESRFVMVSEWMTNGNINTFIETHPEANRFQLLTDVAKGLNHMHSQKMIHGDLKGENILINQTGHACLADFGLLTIASDPTGVTCSNTFLEGGTHRWMSPELFLPEEFHLKDARPTKSSDCYALGMVIYEVLSEQKPYSEYKGYAVVARILNGELPVRPQGAEGRWFTDGVWNILERCWKRSPCDRPGVEDVYRCLEVSRSWTPSQMATDPMKNPSTRNRDPISEESTSEDQVSSSSMAHSPLLRMSLPKGRVMDNLDLGADTRYLHGSDLGKFTDVMDRGASLRRRTIRSHREGSPRFNLTSSRSRTTSDGEVWEPRDYPVPEENVEKTTSGGATMRGGLDTILPLRTFTQILHGWVSNNKSRLIFFFP